MKKLSLNAKSPFLAGVITLMAGTAIAQAIPIAISPILTRLYTPHDLGVFSLFLVASAVLGSIASGRYELAIMLPEDDADAFTLAVLGVIIASCVAILLLVFVALFSGDIAAILGNRSVRPWLYLAPAAVLFLGIFNSLNYLTTRSGGFGAVARANVAKALTGAVVQIGMGLALPGPAGLVTGYTASTAAANARLARRAFETGLITQVSRSRLVRLARRYKDFPKFSVGSALAQTLSLGLTSVLLARYFSVEALGEFSLVQRVLGVPLALVAGSIGQVFFQRSSDSMRETGTFAPVFSTTLRWLSVVAIGSTAVLYFLLPWTFAIVFGDAWRHAGELARCVLPGFAVQFVVSPLSLSNQVNERNRLGLLGNVTALIVMCLALVSAAKLGQSVAHSLLWMSSAQACYYFAFLYLIYRHVNTHSKKGGIQE